MLHLIKLAFVAALVARSKHDHPDPNREQLALTAAKSVGVEYGLLRGIALHETHEHLHHVQVEANGWLSCGVGTSTPVATIGECIAYINGGYAALARDLRVWMDATDPATHEQLSRREALIGFAGGYRLIFLCRRGPVIIRPGVDACLTPDVFDELADRFPQPSRRTSPGRAPRPTS